MSSVLTQYDDEYRALYTTYVCMLLNTMYYKCALQNICNLKITLKENYIFFEINLIYQLIGIYKNLYINTIKNT